MRVRDVNAESTRCKAFECIANDSYCEFYIRAHWWLFLYVNYTSLHTRCFIWMHSGKIWFGHAPSGCGLIRLEIETSQRWMPYSLCDVPTSKMARCIVRWLSTLTSFLASLLFMLTFQSPKRFWEFFILHAIDWSRYPPAFFLIFVARHCIAITDHIYFDSTLWSPPKLHLDHKDFTLARIYFHTTCCGFFN